MDIILKGLLIVSAVLVPLLGLYWLRLVRSYVDPFLNEATRICQGQKTIRQGTRFFYTRVEVTGHYKGRAVSVGIIYTGIAYEFVPLPHVRMQLRGDLASYNSKRLPNFAAMEDGHIIYKVKPQISWGVFDRQYQEIFSNKNLLVVLDSLFTTAENVETTIRSVERPL